MPVDEKVFYAAQEGDRGALVALVGMHYPVVHRMAYALSGSEEVGGKIEKFVMDRAMRRLADWKDESAAERWFYHHTILEARRDVGEKAGREGDLLVKMEAGAQGGDPAFRAFVRAWRELGVQQREAFILHVGEKWPIRGMSVAMDCSTSATTIHLEQAEQTLRSIAGANYDGLKRRLSEVYGALTPPANVLNPAIYSYAAKGRRRSGGRVIKLVILAAAIAGGVWIWARYGDLVMGLFKK